MDSDLDDSQLLPMAKLVLLDHMQQSNDIQPDAAPAAPSVTAKTRKRKDVTVPTLADSESVINQCSKIGSFFKTQMDILGRVLASAVPKEAHDRTVAELAELSKSNRSTYADISETMTSELSKKDEIIKSLQTELEKQRETQMQQSESMMSLYDRLEDASEKLEMIGKWKEQMEAFEGSMDKLEKLYLDKKVKHYSCLFFHLFK